MVSIGQWLSVIGIFCEGLALFWFFWSAPNIFEYFDSQDPMTNSSGWKDIQNTRLQAGFTLLGDVLQLVSVFIP